MFAASARGAMDSFEIDFGNFLKDFAPFLRRFQWKGVAEEILRDSLPQPPSKGMQEEKKFMSRNTGMQPPQVIPLLKSWHVAVLLAPGLLAQPAQSLDRIKGRLDSSHLAAVAGNIRPKVKLGGDRGPVSPSLELEYVTLHLKPTPAQQADLDRLLAQQQDPSSPNFRRWLTPEKYADRFGSSPADIAQIVAWLESQGLTVISTARGRNFVNFKGTAAQVQSALRVEIHNVLVDGEMHYANVTEPSVPEAIRPFTIGFSGLDDFKLKHTAAPVRSVPAYNYGSQHTLGPGDLWVIYDVTPFLFNLGVSGTGMTLAVMGQSNVNLSDMAAYQSYFGLPANPPVKLLFPGATDPGIVSGAEGESDLDLAMAGAIAPYAQILFVYGKVVENALTYSIDQNVAPVVSYSYGACELDQTTSVATSLEVLAQQGNSQGITWIASSGDQGAAACDPGASVASHGLAVNMPASVPEVTAVGGTTLSEGIGSYWAGSNGQYGYSAMSYIPEVGWNDTAVAGHLAASVGGMSIYYPRPVWQNSPGVQRINVRFVPDVALDASADHDPYYTVTTGAPALVGGTSAATPVFAGIILLLNQYLGSNGLGNINPELYTLASTPANVCTPGNLTNHCVFHDVQTGTNIVPCTTGSNGCVGGALGYSAGPGYDQVTGLGSVDAYNLALAWKAANQPVLTQIINGASYVDSGLSPGLIFAVKGSGLGPTIGQSLQLNADGNISNNLAGVQVLVNGTPAPLLYVSATQINAVVPYEIAGTAGQRVNVQVINNGITSGTLSDLVVNTAPAILNLGNSQAAVVNQDGTVNGPGNPAARGSNIAIYATGEGQTTPPGIDGLVPTVASAFSHPNASVSVFMNQFSASVLYAGTSSFDGFFQVNVTVPQNLSPGSVPITLTVGGVASPTLNVNVK
jgi:uncharacterized protein (TIGR03437 family)